MNRRPGESHSDHDGRDRNTGIEGSGEQEKNEAMNNDTNQETANRDDELGLEGELKAMAERMRAEPTTGLGTEPPAGLEGALMGDLHQALPALGTGSPRGASGRGEEPGLAETGVAGAADEAVVTGPWQRWSRSPGLRVAAGLILLVGFSVFLVRGGFFRDGTDRLRPMTATETPSGASSARQAPPESGDAPAEGVGDPLEFAKVAASQAEGPASAEAREPERGQGPRSAALQSSEGGEDRRDLIGQLTTGRGETRPGAEVSGEEARNAAPMDAARVDPVPEGPAPMEETITVTSETPPLEQRSLSRGVQVSAAESERVLAAPAVPRREEFEVDGLSITDMRSEGDGPTHYDFDQFAEASPSAESAVADDAESEKLKALGYVGSGDRKREVQRRRQSLSVRMEENARRLREGSSETIAEAEPALDSDRIFVEERAREIPIHPRVHFDRFDAMTFRDYGISPFIDTEHDAQSTFGLEVDTGSFNLARRYLDAGTLPPPEAIRVEEIVNALDYGDTAPGRDDFRVLVEGTVSPYDESKILLRVGVKARELEERERPAAALTFLIDTSGSMNRENRLGLVQRSLEYLIDRLEPGDTVAIVTYGSHGRVALEPTGDRERIRSVVRSLRSGGSTNLEEGMRLAYQIAGRGVRAGTVSRVILCSDGVANVGLTDAEALLRSVADWGARGVELTTVGVGLGNYNDEMLERLAGRGDGRYAYVDQLEEARRLFVEDLTGTLFTVGRDARVQVTFDSDQIQRYRLIGYENRAIPDHRFRDRRTDGGEIGAGHGVSAVYELELRDGRAPGWFDRIRGEKLGEVALVYRRVAGDGPESGLSEISAPIRLGSVSSGFERAPASLRLAVVAARFAEILRVSPYVEGDLGALFEQAQALVPAFPGDRRVIQFVDMIGAARDRLLRE